MERLQYLFTHHATLPQSLMWVIFGIAVIVLLLWDLLFFNRKNEVPNFVHTLVLCIVYILAACIFGVFVMYEEGAEKGQVAPDLSGSCFCIFNNIQHFTSRLPTCHFCLPLRAV